jgi:hypothetical protein
MPLYHTPIGYCQDDDSTFTWGMPNVTFNVTGLVALSLVRDVFRSVPRE